MLFGHLIGGESLVLAGLYGCKLIALPSRTNDLYFVPIILVRTWGLEHESLSS